MKKKKKSLLVTIVSAIIIFVIIYYFGLVSRAEQGFFKFFSPLQKQLYNWGTAFNRFNQLGEILKENEYLKSEFSKLSVDYVKLANLEAENAYLRGELNYLEENRFAYAMADVIGKQVYNPQILFINKGGNDGLLEGAAVTAGEGVIVGKVISVTPERSQVQLLTDPGSQLAAALSEETGTTGIIKGSAGNSLVMEFIPQNLLINEGDMIITSGLEEHVPRGLLVGTITGVENLVGRIFQKANVLPPFNYLNLQALTVIIPKTVVK